MSLEKLSDAIKEGNLDLAGEQLIAIPGLLHQRVPPQKTLHHDRGVTPLHLAVYTGNASMVALLIEMGADLDVRNEYGRSPLHDSIEYGQGAITQLLRERGAQVDICSASIIGLGAEVREWLQRDASLVNDYTTNLTPLGWAAFGDQAEVAQLLLNHGATMDDFELHCAASVGHTKVARVMIEAGSDPSAIHPKTGLAAIHVAASMPYTNEAVSFIEMLLECGVDPRLESGQGMTAAALAEEKSKQDNAGPAKDFEGILAVLRRAVDG
jgi:ankyrin repeat protein